MNISIIYAKLINQDIESDFNRIHYKDKYIDVEYKDYIFYAIIFSFVKILIFDFIFLILNALFIYDHNDPFILILILPIMFIYILYKDIKIIELRTKINKILEHQDLNI